MQRKRKIMLDKLFKKKVKIPGSPNKENEGEEEDEIKLPEVDETLDDIDAALAKADAIKEQKAKEKAQKTYDELQRELRRQRERGGGGCGCGF
jgi:hypothetical protein